MTGIPVMRPLWMEFPDDEETYSNDEAFMVGNSLLVQGIYTAVRPLSDFFSQIHFCFILSLITTNFNNEIWHQQTKQVSVYLPGEQSWYDLRTGTAYKGGKSYNLEVSDDSIPSFQRAGTIVPRKDRFRRSSRQMEKDPYTLVQF